MSTTDDLATLWQTEGSPTVSSLPPPVIDRLVHKAHVSNRVSAWPVVVSAIVLVWVTQTQRPLLEATGARVEANLIVGFMPIGIALLSLCIAWVSGHLQREALAIAEPFDDLALREHAALSKPRRFLTRLRRWQWATGLLIVTTAHWVAVVLGSVWLAGEMNSFLTPVLTAVALFGTLVVSWLRLKRLAAPLSHQTQRFLSGPPASALVGPSDASAGPDEPLRSDGLTSSESWTSSKPSSSSSSPSSSMADSTPASLSSAAMVSLRHFRTTSIGHLSDRERRSWRLVVALMVVAVVPQLIDAIAVVALQGGPAPGASDVARELHRVMPSLPTIVSILGSLVMPMLLIFSRDALDRRFIGRFTWLWVLLLSGLPTVFSLGSLLVVGEDNAHLWSYSWTSEGLTKFLAELPGVRARQIDDLWAFFFVLTSLSMLARVMRFFALVVVAVGLRRLVGPGRLRTAVSVLLGVQAIVWLATVFVSSSPELWRGVVDIVVAVGLLLVAVFSQRAFEEPR
jgi:hypothetical protein